MWSKNALTEEEIKKIVEEYENMTWEDLVENTTIHFWELDPNNFKHRKDIDYGKNDEIRKFNIMAKKKDKRKYPCPKCATGELYDEGGMFMAIIACTNPDCDYNDFPDCGAINAG